MTRTATNFTAALAAILLTMLTFQQAVTMPVHQQSVATVTLA